MAFWFISDSGPTEIDDPTAADIADFRSNALETTMYYAEKGEAIVVSHGNRSILIDGGGGQPLESNVRHHGGPSLRRRGRQK